jgi:tetratricopeptide (TPR) repeat protein
MPLSFRKPTFCNDRGAAILPTGRPFGRLDPLESGSAGWKARPTASADWQPPRTKWHWVANLRADCQSAPHWIALALALLILAPALCPAQDRTAEALRKGIVEEETNRNLDAAIQSYQSVLAQYDEDRKSAATALFRIAECYRKQGKSTEAIAAYSRVVREFADQARLAEQSRNQLSKTYKIPQPQTAGPIDPATAEARKRYRAILEEEIQDFQKIVDFVHQQVLLGAVAVQDTYDVQADLARLKSRLAAFDAGLIPQAPAGARTPEALAARAQYRALLQTEVDYAAKDLERERERYKLGAESLQSVVDAQHKLAEAKLEMAALEAGLAQPPNPAPAQ